MIKDELEFRQTDFLTIPHYNGGIERHGEHQNEHPENEEYQPTGGEIHNLDGE